MIIPPPALSGGPHKSEICPSPGVAKSALGGEAFVTATSLAGDDAGPIPTELIADIL